MIHHTRMSWECHEAEICDTTADLIIYFVSALISEHAAGVAAGYSKVLLLVLWTALSRD